MVLACHPGTPDELSVASDEFNGTFLLPVGSNCGPFIPLLQGALNVLVNQINDPNQALFKCMEDSVMSPDASNPEWSWARLTENISTTVTCNACSNPAFSGCADIDIPDEEINLTPGFLSAATPAQVAGLVLHELMHNKGYTHPTAPGTPEYVHSVTEQYRLCSINGDPRQLRRSELGDEVELGTLGGPGGQPFVSACPQGKFMTGAVAGFSEANAGAVSALTMTCRTPGATDVTFSPIVGVFDNPDIRSPSNPFGWFLDTCAVDSFVTRIEGRHGSLIDRFAFRCNSEAELAADETTFHDLHPLNAAGGGIGFDRVCPPGQAVQRVYGRFGDAIDRMRFVCSDLDEADRSIRFIYSDLFGTTNGYQRDRRCAGFGAFTGLYGLSGNRVDRIGGRCRALDETRAGYQINPRWTITHSAGGTGGGDFSLDCPSSEVMVGVIVRHGTEIDAVQARCADPNAYVAAGPTPPLTITTRRGGGGGERQVWDCPRGYLVAGLLSWHDQVVNGLRVICREF